MSVEAILHHKGVNVATIGPATSIQQAAHRLRSENIGALVVVDGNTILGLVSEREIVHALAKFGDVLPTMTVTRMMHSDIATVTPDDSVKRAMRLMTSRRTSHLPVIRNGKLVGIVSIGDLVKHRLNDLELETNVLRDAYIMAHQ